MTAAVIFIAAVVYLLMPYSTSKLVSRLYSSKNNVRQAAVEALISRGRSVVPEVCGVFDDPNADSTTLISALIVIDNVAEPGDGHEPFVARMLGASKENIWRKALAIIEKSGHEGVMHSIPLLSHSESAVKCRIMFLLNKYGKVEDGFKDKVLVLLNDSDVNTVRSAIDTVARFDFVEALPKLIELLPMSEYNREHLPLIIAKMADDGVVSRLIEKMETGEEWFVRVSAAQTLGLIAGRPDKMARETITKRLYANINPDLPRLRGEILLVLASLGEGYEVINDGISAPQAHVRLKAILAMHKLSPLKSINYIIQGLRDKDDNVVNQSVTLITSLYKLFPKKLEKAITALGLLCDDPRYDNHVADLLFQMTGVDFLAAAGRDRGEVVRKWLIRFGNRPRWESVDYALFNYIASLRYPDSDAQATRALLRIKEITGDDFGFGKAKTESEKESILEKMEKWRCDYREKQSSH